MDSLKKMKIILNGVYGNCDESSARVEEQREGCNHGGLICYEKPLLFIK